METALGMLSHFFDLILERGKHRLNCRPVRRILLLCGRQLEEVWSILRWHVKMMLTCGPSMVATVYCHANMAVNSGVWLEQSYRLKVKLGLLTLFRKKNVCDWCVVVVKTGIFATVNHNIYTPYTPVSQRQMTKSISAFCITNDGKPIVRWTGGFVCLCVLIRLQTYDSVLTLPVLFIKVIR